jgi:hypothetical protein
LKAIDEARKLTALAEREGSKSDEAFLMLTRAVALLVSELARLNALPKPNPRISLRGAMRLARVSYRTAMQKVDSGAWKTHREGNRLYVLTESVETDLTRTEGD